MTRTPRLPLFPPAGPSADAPAPPAARLPRLLLRTAATASAALAVAQTVLAGGFLNGHYEALRAHEVAATALGGVLVVQLVAAALLLRRAGGPAGVRGPRWPLGTTALLLAVVGAQMVTGYERAVGVHLTLGVLTVSAVLFVLVGTWRLPSPASPPPPPPSVPSSARVDAGGAGADASAGADGAPEDGTGRLPRPAGTGGPAVAGGPAGPGTLTGSGPAEVAQ
ncbi:hypothetical protein ACFCX4_31385 [Kitasatospora sp. NPDC056327]|uniref:hypothetical protein n=1 Tax=Kitasatospora sp. NPDC056327 TaxID=3345785 RepID=UPI0035DFF5D0